MAAGCIPTLFFAEKKKIPRYTIVATTVFFHVLTVLTVCCILPINPRNSSVKGDLYFADITEMRNDYKLA